MATICERRRPILYRVERKNVGNDGISIFPGELAECAALMMLARDEI